MLRLGAALLFGALAMSCTHTAASRNDVTTAAIDAHARGESASEASARISFERVLQRHLHAISTRDLPVLIDTITTGEQLDLYLPNGARTATRDEFISTHEAWFAESGWSIEFALVSARVTEELALATVNSRYTEGANWSENWLTLTFQKEDGDWRLVHDQNTRIRSGTVP